jgi:AraC-like DNA-binding protein
MQDWHKYRMMLRYVVQTSELYDVLGVLYDVLGITVSFYDVGFQELSFLDKKKQAPYCRYRRKNKNFIRYCKICDRKYFELARQTKQIQIYTCHTGLLDGIVPIYDDYGKFLGGIIFGQVRPVGKKNPHSPGSKLWHYYEAMPVSSLAKLKRIGQLVKLITEMIVRHQMVSFKSLCWTEKLERYIESHINEKITIQQLSELVHRSPSFITHHFKNELGLSPAVYIRNKRMDIALQMLQKGQQIKQVADLLGFYDAFHFSRVFKKHFGKPPVGFKVSVEENSQL